MSVVMYKTASNYFYALEIGIPNETVLFGEGCSPQEAVSRMQKTQYQAAHFGCIGPANSRLAELFDLDIDEEIIDCTEAEEDAAAEALDGSEY